MKKRTQKSQKRTKFLFILIILTAILSITATYAWFSTQRDVEISGLKVKVESAQNLQISLDGVNWSQTITIEDMKQLYGTYSSTDVYSAVEDEHRNYIPTELLPVSTVGEVGLRREGTLAEGVTEGSAEDTRTKAPYLKFVQGVVDGKELNTITACNEDDITVGAETLTKEGNNDNHPYLAFDIYLRNLSNRGSNVYTEEEVGKTVDGVSVTDDMVGDPKPSYYDPLQLDKGSRVWIDSDGTTGTGLEYSSRVALMPWGGSADLTADGETVRAIEADGTEKVSIWEPNHDQHTDYVVNNNKRAITANTQAVVTYPIKSAAVGNTVTDVNATSGTYLQATTTVQAANATADDVATDSTLTEGATKEVKDLVTPDGADKISLKPNQISKVRVYLWLEGQDPDCIDLASTGKELSATIRIVKPEYETSTGNSYAGGETTTTAAATESTESGS